MMSNSLLYTLHIRYTVSPAFNCIKLAWVAGFGYESSQVGMHRCRVRDPRCYRKKSTRPHSQSGDVCTHPYAIVVKNAESIGVSVLETPKRQRKTPKRQQKTPQRWVGNASRTLVERHF